MGHPFGRQIWTLTRKNLRISVQRHWLSTLIRAVLAPIIYMFFIAYMKNLFVPPSEFGIGSPVPIRGFIDALEASTGGRNTVAFVKSGHNGGQIEDLIEYLSVSVTTAGKTPQVLDTEGDLLTVCRNSLRGASSCYGAAVFYSSPTEGDAGFWNYTLRADGALVLVVLWWRVEARILMLVSRARRGGYRWLGGKSRGGTLGRLEERSGLRRVSGHFAAVRKCLEVSVYSGVMRFA